MPKIDYLIVGQGLAGSLLGWQLMQQGRRIHILDNGHRSSSSRVAAGVINPLAGWRFVLPERIDDWLDTARGLYRWLEHQFDQPLLHELAMLRLFQSQKQLVYWQRQKNNPKASPYLGDYFTAAPQNNPVTAPHGGFLQHKTGYVDMALLLKLLKDLFQQRGVLTSTMLDYRDMHITEHGVCWKETQAEKIIFCEGYKSMYNPWFKWLPFLPAKGEILRLKGLKQHADKIINGRHWLVPLNNGSFRFGATFDHQHFDNQPTAAGRDCLLSALQDMLPAEDTLELLEQTAGVRPATEDKQPFIGLHPKYPSLAIFNGFGAKGALTIPWYSQQFIGYLEHTAALPEEADIQRLTDKFSDN